MDDEWPPPVDPDKLDFSQFHPTGDHWPFTAHCREFYGGGRVHLRYAWEYRWRSEVRSRVLCRLGWHHYSRAAMKEPDGSWRRFTACYDCGKRK